MYQPITIVLLNKILKKGMGDFTHLLDIYQAFKKNSLAVHCDFKFLIFYDKNEKNITELLAKKLSNINVNLENVYLISYETKDNDYHGDIRQQIIKQLEGDSPLRTVLSNTAILYEISTPLEDIDLIIKTLPPDTPILSLGEHGGMSAYWEKKKKKKGYSNQYHMGFAGSEHRQFGIKLNIPNNISKLTTLQNFANKTFVHALLGTEKITQETVNHFYAETLFVPTYWQIMKITYRFIHWVISATHEKNIIFYVRANSFKDEFDRDFLNAAGINKIILNDNGKTKAIEINSANKRVLSILYDFDLGDNDYPNLYRLATVYGGCSGDNTLEYVVSNKLLPLWHIRPWKRDVINFLEELIEHIQEIPKKDRKILREYLQWLQTFNFDKVENISFINYETLQVIVKAWQNCVEYLHKKYNFYDTLDNLFNKSLRFVADKKNLPALQQQLSTITPANFSLVRENRLIQAAFLGAIDTLKALLAEKADINVQDDMGNTPIIFAVRYNQPAAIKFLLEQNPKPNLKLANAYGKIPLHFACEKNNKELIDLLLAHSDIEDTYTPDNDGMTPCDLLNDDKLYFEILSKFILSEKGQMQQLSVNVPINSASFFKPVASLNSTSARTTQFEDAKNESKKEDSNDHRP